MNRFKGWNTVSKVMFTPEEMSRDQLTLMPNGSGFWNIHSVDTRLSEKCTQMIPLEYIGEKDSTKKEICEGDILKWNISSKNNLSVDPYLNSKRWIVERTHCGWNPFIDDCQEDGTWHYTIIGNIYENPELVKEKN